MDDREYMQRALNLARKGQGKTSPNPMVGCLLVRKNRIIAQGWHKVCGGDHAEINALKKAKRSARGATMVINLEPCYHFGHTPPCVDSILKSGIKEVVIGMKDPNPLTNGKSIIKLKRSGIKVKVGVLEKECRRLNEIFIKYVTTHMPFVAAKCAQTLDGKIATANGDSKWITSEKTRQLARSIRGRYDAILVGINTVLKDNPRLSAFPKTKRLKKIIVDSSLRIPLRASLFKNTPPQDCVIATTAKANRSKLKALQQKGVQVIFCPSREGKINLNFFFKKLAQQEITSILIEGGGQVVGSALKEKLVDKMYMYLAPKIIGDRRAVNSIDGLNVSRLHQCVQLDKMDMKKVAQDILLEGYVYRDR